MHARVAVLLGPAGGRIGPAGPRSTWTTKRPGARGGRSAGPHRICSPRPTGQNTLVRGSHRPVRSTLTICLTGANRPNGPSLQAAESTILTPVDARTQAVLFNAVPLLVLAALLLTIALGVSLPLLRDRSRMGRVEIAFALVFPCLGIAALVGGLLLLDEPEPVGGHPLVFLGAIVLAAVPAVAFLASWRQLASLGADRSKDLVAMSQLSRDLVQAPDARAVARMLVGEAQVALSGDLV